MTALFCWICLKSIQQKHLAIDMSTEKGPIEVAVIRKAEGAEIRITVSVYNGRRVVDVRVWYQPRDSVEYVPTRKGVTFDSDKLPALAEAIAQAMAIAEEG
jgi:Transcriptional Coactivator p15 (PC4)